MADLLEVLTQAILSIGLVYGLITVFHTVPPGADSDVEFANHSHFTPAPPGPQLTG